MVGLDGIVQRCLPVVVHMVQSRANLVHSLRGSQLAVVDGVVDRILAVNINFVYIEPVLDHHLD